MPVVVNPQPLAPVMMMTMPNMKTMTMATKMTSSSLKRTSSPNYVSFFVHAGAGCSHQAHPTI